MTEKEIITHEVIEEYLEFKEEGEVTKNRTDYEVKDKVIMQDKDCERINLSEIEKKHHSTKSDLK